MNSIECDGDCVVISSQEEITADERKELKNIIGEELFKKLDNIAKEVSTNKPQTDAIDQIVELVHPVTGKKAFELVWKNGEHWRIQPPTSHEYEQWLRTLRETMQILAEAGGTTGEKTLSTNVPTEYNGPLT